MNLKLIQMSGSLESLPAAIKARKERFLEIIKVYWGLYAYVINFKKTFLLIWGKLMDAILFTFDIYCFLFWCI